VREPPEMIAVRRHFAGDTGPADRLEIHFEPDIIPGYRPRRDGWRGLSRSGRCGVTRCARDWAARAPTPSGCWWPATRPGW
jgi:hypothetical protein